MDIITRAEARGRGLKRYFTAQACPRGHTAERITSNGACSDCLKENIKAKRKADPARRAQEAKTHRYKRIEHYKEKERERYRLKRLDANLDDFLATIEQDDEA